MSLKQISVGALGGALADEWVAANVLGPLPDRFVALLALTLVIGVLMEMGANAYERQRRLQQ